MLTEIIVSFFSGTFGGATLNYFSQEKFRKVNLLRNQIDKFYGPIYFLLMSILSNIEIANEIEKAGGRAFSTEYLGKERVQSRIDKDTSEINDVFTWSNSYVIDAIKTNERIFLIISNNFSFIDPSDIGATQKFLKNFLRLNKEHSKHLGNKSTDERELPAIPSRVGEYLDDVKIIMDEFTKQINSKFMEKNSELQELHESKFDRLYRLMARWLPCHK